MKKEPQPREARATRARRQGAKPAGTGNEAARPVEDSPPGIESGVYPPAASAKDPLPPFTFDDGRGDEAHRKEAWPFTLDNKEYAPPQPGMAERRAKLEDELADKFEASGYSEPAGERRAKAIWWRKLAGAEAPEGKTWRECKRDALAATDALIALAEREDDLYKNPALDHLKAITSHLHWAFHMLAANGNKRAASIWGDVLLDSATDFERLAWHKPKLIEEWAQGQVSIPGRISQYRGLAKSNAELVKLLRVGESSPLPLVPSGRRGNSLDYSKRVNKWAADLLNYIDSERGNYDLYKYHAEEAGRRLPGWQEKASKLKSFIGETWESWAEVAWDILMVRTSRHPEDHPELRPLGASAAKKKPKLVKVLHNATASANVRAKIKSRFRQAFKLMAESKR